MHFHAKSESEVTSMGASSSSTPRRPLYFVQSPTSRESFPDGDKTPFSVHSANFTPLGSPSHRSVSASASVSGRHSRTSSGTHFWSKVIPDESHSRTKWPHANAIAEEAFRDDNSDGRKILPRRCHIVLFVLCFALLFAVFCLALWGASRPYKPKVILKSIVFSDFHVYEGADETGVPTIMVSANSTLKLSVYNPAKFFGIHVVSTPVNLMYNELSVATGQLQEYYQSRMSHSVASIVVDGERVPLYGAGGSLSGTNENGDIPLDLVFSIQSRAYVLGKLVKHKFRRRIHCKIVLDSNRLKVIRSLQKACQYD
uniref:Uncharacterized protein n=1 Tax=Picea sitchensis TaxID=3332 RepID=D5AAI7_PICSI|nr:unknown [Picea sitchensis]